MRSHIKAAPILPMLMAGVMAFLVILPGTSKGNGEYEEPVPIRIGWQIPAAMQALVTQVLKRTDVLERHGLEPSLVPFSYGAPQVAAALEGQLDAFFAGDQPAINLIERGGKWKIVARLFYDRIAFIVPPNSPAHKIEDLRGKIVASPFGSVAHREAILGQQAAGLDGSKDVTNVNRDILEIRRRVLAGGVEAWEEMDAAVVWEPNVSAFELGGLARTLSEKRTLGVVAISDEFIANNPDAAVRFLVSVVRAWDFLSHNPDRVMRWYIDDTKLDYTPEALTSTARLDPNFNTRTLQDINLELNEDLIAILEQGAAWARDGWDDGSHIRESIDQSLLAMAMNEISTAEFEDIQIILPSIRQASALETEEVFNLDSVPLAVLLVFMVLIALLAIEAGFWLGLRRQKKVVYEQVGPIATVVGAVLALLAFVIALTFGAASSRFDARKEALLHDVNAIQTAYLRANLLPEPHRTTVRSLLRDYVQVRVGMVYAYGDPATLQVVQKRAEALQKSMWSHVEILASQDRHSPIYALFTSALNDMFDLHTERVVLGAHYRMPRFVWWTLILASCVAMVAVGFQFAIGGKRRSLTANLALAITFALVMLLVFDLDRAGEGFITVNQQPMIDLYQGMSQQHT